MPPPIPAGREFGRLFARNPVPRNFPTAGYPINATDVAYLAVASQHEEPWAPVYPTWCMIQRFATYYGRGIGGRNISRCVKNFSQPVNERWAWPSRQRAVFHPRTGEMLPPGVTRASIDAGMGDRVSGTFKSRYYWHRVHLGTATAAMRRSIAPDRLRDRRENIARIRGIIAGQEEHWNRVSQNIRSAVDAICRGSCGNPIPGLNNFAATSLFGDRAAMAWDLSAEEQLRWHSQTRRRARGRGVTLYGLVFTRNERSSGQTRVGNVYAQDLGLTCPREIWIAGPDGDSRPPTDIGAYSWDRTDLFISGGAGGAGGGGGGGGARIATVSSDRTTTRGPSSTESGPAAIAAAARSGPLLTEAEVTSRMEAWADEMEIELATLTGLD